MVWSFTGPTFVPRRRSPGCLFCGMDASPKSLSLTTPETRAITTSDLVSDWLSLALKTARLLRAERCLPATYASRGVTVDSAGRQTHRFTVGKNWFCGLR